MASVWYTSGLFENCDFFGPVGQYDTHLISGAPKTKQEYTTIFRPYDEYTWAFLISFTVTVSVSLILINKIYANFTNQPTEETAYQSRLQINEYHLYIFKMVANLSGILFAIGAVVDEAQGNHDKNNYLAARKGSLARSIVVFNWMVIGVILAMSYKAVLRAILMQESYEKPIDTIDDMIESGLKLLAPQDTPLWPAVTYDPRQKVQDMLKVTKVIEWYEMGNGNPPWVDIG